MRLADAGILELQKHVDTLIVIPNQNLFRIANDKTTFADAFAMADEVLYSGVACITDLMVKDGLINLDFADVRSVMREMGKAMMGTGEASGDKRAIEAAEKAISNPLLDDVCMRGAKGLLISITGGRDMTLFEVDEAASRVREEVEADANIIFGATFDESLEGIIRVSVVATGIEQERVQEQVAPPTAGMAELTRRLKSVGAPAGAARAAGASAASRSSRSGKPCRPMRWKGWSRNSPCRSRRRRSSARPQRPAGRAAAPGRRPAGQDRAVPSRPVAGLDAASRGRGRASARQRGGARRRGRAVHPARCRAPGGSPGAHAAGGGFPGGGAAADAGAAGSPAGAEEERRPRGLLARLASGLTRREDDAEPPRQSHPARRNEGEPRVVAAARRRMPHPAATPAAEFAKPAQPRRSGEQSGAAGQSRSRAGAAFPTEAGRDDQLEIPAFLRRQTS